jgi:hypothetical protein
MAQAILPDYDDICDLPITKKKKALIVLTPEAVDELLRTESDDSDEGATDSENGVNGSDRKTVGTAHDKLPTETDIVKTEPMDIPAGPSSAEEQPLTDQPMDLSDSMTRTEVRDRNEKIERWTVIKRRQPAKTGQTPVIKTELIPRQETHMWDWPNIPARLCAILALLTRPDICVNTMTRMDTLKNDWKEEISQIKQRMNSGQIVSASEATLVKKHGSFFFSDSLRAFHAFLMARSYRVMSQCSEILMVRPTYQLPDHQAPNYYGPAMMERMTEDLSWVTNLKAVVVGNLGLYYLPMELNGKFLNLSDKFTFPYFVPTCTNEMDTIISTPGSLYQRLQRIIGFVGSTKIWPIFVEFYMEPTNQHKDLVWHLVGFLQTVKACQQDYAGPLIAILGPIGPVPVGGENQYHAQKAGLYRAHNLARLVGRALGVAVALMPIHQVEVLRSQEWINFHFWRKSPLYLSTGDPTREFFKRITFYLEGCLPYIATAQFYIKKEPTENETAEYVENA